MEWLCHGWLAGYWFEAGPPKGWIPEVYRTKSLLELQSLKSKILGDLQRAKASKNGRPKTHAF